MLRMSEVIYCHQLLKLIHNQLKISSGLSKILMFVTINNTNVFLIHKIYLSFSIHNIFHLIFFQSELLESIIGSAAFR